MRVKKKKCGVVPEAFPIKPSDHPPSCLYALRCFSWLSSRRQQGQTERQSQFNQLWGIGGWRTFCHRQEVLL
jgi:hypothetical protein